MRPGPISFMGAGSGVSIQILRSIRDGFRPRLEIAVQVAS